jgi:hypothetical protein
VLAGPLLGEGFPVLAFLYAAVANQIGIGVSTVTASRTLMHRLSP